MPGEKHCEETADDSSAGQALPRIDAARCVHGQCAIASCRACADACPRQALVLSERGLGLDEGACDGCGLCRPACPESAIALKGIGTDMAVIGRSGRAVLACDRAGVAEAPGVVPCLHAAGERDIAEWEARGVATLITARGDCATCPRRTQRTLEAAFARYQVTRPVGGNSMRMETVPAGAWSAARSDIIRNRDDFDQGRRSLFSSILSRNGATLSGAAGRGAQAGGAASRGKVCRFVPSVDTKVCKGCDACARICPHAAITIERQAGVLGYAIFPERCTSCGLCRDVCDVDAVRIAEMSVCDVRYVPLLECACTKCGGAFHVPRDKNGEPAVCAICAKKNYARLLFQVRSEDPRES